MISNSPDSPRRKNVHWTPSRGKLSLDVEFSRLFFKQLMVEGDVFLVLNDKDRARALAYENMSSGQAMRWAAFELKRYDCIAEGSRADSCCFVNTSTNASFAGIPKTGVVGTLVRNSRLAELKTAREVAPLEYWLMQGYPVPLDCSASLSVTGTQPLSVFHGLFPQAWLDFSLKEVSELTGNGMHMASVSAFLFFALGTASTDAVD